jgi:hypothetical protein
MKEKLKLIRMRHLFDAFKFGRNIHYNMLNRLNNFSRVMDHHVTQTAFLDISSFARAKAFAHQRRKEQAARDLVNHMDMLKKRQLESTISQLKVVPIMRYNKGLKQFNTVMRNFTDQQRRCFQLWKNKAQEHTLVKEMNEEGPIREEIWNLNKDQTNLRMFMTEEGYTPEDIHKLEDHGAKQFCRLMKKAKLRMEHYNEDLYTKPKAFDRWRQFV